MIEEDKSIEFKRLASSRSSKRGAARGNTTSFSVNVNEHHFFMSGGIRKRRIYHDVSYSEEEKQWIKDVRHALVRDKSIEISEGEVLLRYYYAGNLKMQPTIQNLSAYHRWFNDPEIQLLTAQGKQVLKTGYVYNYDYSKNGSPFAVMQMGDVNFQKHKLNYYMQAMNYVNNTMISQKLIHGHIETYDYILDLNEKFLSLPITALKDIIRMISEAYSMMLGKMYVINCTTFAKFVYSGIEKILSQETRAKIKLYTSAEVSKGVLREFIDEDVLEEKYGGKRVNVDFEVMFANCDREDLNMSCETEYFTVDENNPMFANNQSHACCGGKQCAIY